MIVLPVSAGKKDQYGLLIPIESAQINLDIASAQKLLADSKIKATVTDTYDGEQLMVFEKDYQKAMRVLGVDPDQSWKHFDRPGISVTSDPFVTKAR